MSRRPTLPRLALLLGSLLTAACAPMHLLGYSLFPDYPDAPETAEYRLPGISSPVTVTLRDDGLYRIAAENEADLFYVQGYLQARDRLFQMDFIRRMAEGRLSEVLGNQSMGDKTTVDLDVFNRFMGFSEQAEALYAAMGPDERVALDAFADGVNAWIATGERTLEHRLLDATMRPWRATDSLTIFRVLMFGLTHNYTRELRRLVIACASGIDAMERVWPSAIEFGPYFLPTEALGEGEYTLPPAVVPEMRDELAALCPDGAGKSTLAQNDNLELYNPLQLLQGGIQSSNNWVVAGSRTASGKPLLANDPHLPQLNPPIVWGITQALPETEVSGFTIVGVPLAFVGHNFHVAWGSTINNVDLQDLYVQKPARLSDGTDGYAYDGTAVAWERRTERIHVKGEKPVEVTVRFSKHGPLLNDLDPFLRDRIPLTALHSVNLDDTNDARALRKAAYAKNAREYVEAMQDFDSACISWVFADTSGDIGFTSPCRVPVRPSHLGTFPVPGWTSAYEWTGVYDKAQLPRVMNPEQGWIATANNRSLPSSRFATPYNNDPSPPNRYVRIADRLNEKPTLTLEDMSAIQMDTGLSYGPALVAEFRDVLCGRSFGSPITDTAAGHLCEWNADASADSVGATLFALLTHAVLDRAMADDLPGGAEGELWKFVQSIPHFETNVDWLWTRAAIDPVWDDVRTPKVENRAMILRAAFEDAVGVARERYGDDPAAWKWGTVRPFVLQHPFGGKGGILGSVFNADALAGTGAPETVFKNQYLRSDRARMHVMAGPSLRFAADLSDLHKSRFSLAGGESGWPGSPHYADLTQEWMEGKTRALSPRPEETKVKAVWIFVDGRPSEKQ